MAFQVVPDFFLNPPFEDRQQQAKLCLDMDFAVNDCNGSGHTTALEVDNIILPAVINGEFFSQVCREFVGSLLCGFVVHVVQGANINRRHHLNTHLPGPVFAARYADGVHLAEQPEPT